MAKGTTQAFRGEAALLEASRALTMLRVCCTQTSTGMCHSDLHIWEGYFNMGKGADGKDIKMPLPLKFPFTLGHEMEGRIVAAGPDVPSQYQPAVSERANDAGSWLLCACARIVRTPLCCAGACM